MKRIHSIFALIIMIFLAWSPAYSQEWSITYGGSGSEGASSIQEVSDGYIVAGWSGSFGVGGNDVWVLKLHSNGTVSWQKTYGRSGYDWTYSIEQTADGGYVVAGSSWSYDEGEYDFWVLKLDDSGHIAWQKTYGGSDDDHPRSIQQTVDAAGNPDGYIVAGYTGSFGAGSYDVWVLRLDSGGSVVWENVYGGSEYDTVGSIQQIFDQDGLPDGYVMAGITHSFGAGKYDIWVLKLLSDGTISWQKTYGGLDDEGADSIRQTFDGSGNPNGFIVAGGAWADSESFGHVLRLNNDGSLVWQKGFGAWSFDTRYFVEQTDGGFIVAGGDDEASQSDIWVAKLDSGGDIAWQNAYGGANQDSFGSLKPTADGGYIVAGCTTSFGMGAADFSVLKLDANGSIPNCSALIGSNVTYWNITPVVGDSTADPVGTFSSVSSTSVSPETTNAGISEVCCEVAADFTATPRLGTGALTVQLTDHSRSAGSPITWLWDFGDEETSTEQNPSHTYTTTGDFDVSLTVSGPNGSDTETKVDYIQVMEGQAYQEVWPDPTPGATPIQDAIVVAATGGTILAHDGTYLENIDFLGKAITIESENGPDVTIIDGSDSGNVVTFESGEGPAAVLEGFTIRNGNYYGIWCSGSGTAPTITNCVITQNYDRGMYCDNANPTVTGCTFTYNEGGLHCWESSPTITDCTFSHNSVEFYGGGIFLINGSSAEITDCVFTNNHGDLGGGICIHTDSNATITDCTFIDNTAKMGGGIDIALSNPIISGCTISGNAATPDSFYDGEGGGILIRWDSNPTIFNCYVGANSAEDGGGIYCENSNPTITNCTVRDNTANSHGGGFYCYDSYEAGNGPTVVNTILWEDMAGGTPNEVYLGFGGFIDITYSDIQGGWSGTGNLDCNPDFVDTGDYHLLASSCCINTGTSEGAPGDDIDGETRPQGGGYDMGADEYYPIHAGFVVMDKEVYGPLLDVGIVIADSDLDTDSGQIEQYSDILTIITDHDGTVYDTETAVDMTETGPDTGVFTGTITLADSPAGSENGILEIACQTPETIVATYHDADDGTGNPANPTDMADTDCAAPVISNVQVTHTGYTVAVISWDTDEPADSTIAYGPSLSLGSSETDFSLKTSHVMHLTGLEPDTTYYFEVTSADEVGNEFTDDNSGQYYQFQTSVLPAYHWATTYGGSADDTTYSVKQTFDEWEDPNGYIAAGNTHSFGNGHDDYWIVRLDLSGAILWEKSYGTDTFEYAVSTDQTEDGGYVVFGNSYYHNYDGRDFWVLKLNPDGSSAWQNIYGSSSDNDSAYAGQETVDEFGNADGYVAVGFTASFGAGEGDVWVLKLNSSGDISWQKTYGGNAHDGGYDIHQTADGGYVVAGTTESFAGSEQDMFVLKLNKDGGVEWQKAYDYGGYERANTVRQTTNGGYVVAGETGMMYEADVLILKLDPDGEVIWSKTYSAPYQDDARAIRETSDGNYAVAGWTMPAGGGAQQFWVLKLDSGDGSLLWQKSYGSACYDGANSVEETVDGGLIVGGASSFGEGSNDMWLLKLDEYGDIPGCNISSPGDGIVSDAGITGIDTDATVVDSSISPLGTSIAAHNTSAVAWNTCATPTADFSADVTSGVKPLAVEFTDESTGAVASWSWDFDNNGTEDSAEQNPSHTYTEAGNYNVSLTVTGPGGPDTETKTDYIHVEALPAPYISQISPRQQEPTVPYPYMASWLSARLGYTVTNPRWGRVGIYGDNFGSSQMVGDEVRIGDPLGPDVLNYNTDGDYYTVEDIHDGIELKIGLWRNDLVGVYLFPAEGEIVPALYGPGNPGLGTLWLDKWLGLWVVKDNDSAPVASNVKPIRVITPLHD